MKAPLLGLLLALPVCLPAAAIAAEAAAPVLVRDLDPRPHDPQVNPGNAAQFTRAGSRAVFVRKISYLAPSELWASDGTPAGTGRLRTLPADLRILGATESLAFFTAPLQSGLQPAPPSVLWRTDGTRAGTFVLGPATAVTDPFEPPAAIALGGALLFSGCTPAGGCELWASDGTPAGTRRLREILPGQGSSAPRGFTVWGNLAWFFADDPAGIALWRSDGTTGGTQRVRSLPPFTLPHQPFVQGARLYFTAGASYLSETGTGPDLWTTDGTAAGTRQVAPFDSSRGHDAGAPQVVSLLPGLGDRAAFLGVEGKRDYQLWITDPAARAAHPVTAVPPLPANAEHFPFAGTGAVNGRLLFTVDGRLWATRGTLASSRPLAGCSPACPPGVEIWGDAPAGGAFGGGLLFSSQTAENASLWLSDGTGAGTRKLYDLCTGSCDDADPPRLAWTLPGKTFFFYRQSLWVTDGSPAGPRALADFPDFLTADGSPAFALLPGAGGGGRAVFTTSGLEEGLKLRATDGTPAGTADLGPIEEGVSSSPKGFVPFGRGMLFFACVDGVGVPWASDGTREGTIPLPAASSCREGTANDPVQPIFRLGDTAFFTGWTGDFVTRLWRTDGTPAGTVPIFRPGDDEYLADVGIFRGRLVFLTVAGPETRFWVSDGTAAGTSRLFALPLQFVYGLKQVGDRLLFAAEDSSGQFSFDLWVSDGTLAGTRVLMGPVGGVPDFVPYRGEFWFASGALVRTDLTPEGTAFVLPSDASPDPFYAIDRLAPFAGSLLFIAQRGDPYGGSYVLYRSDGTARGTTALGEVGTNDLGFDSPPPSVAAGRFLYFVSADAEHGQELWRTDGTAAGTLEVADLFPGAGSSAPLDLTADGDRLFFTADDGEHGRELWVTGGVPGDPRPVGRRNDGTLSLDPQGLTLAGDRLFFSADDGVNGRELWLLPLTPR